MKYSQAEQLGIAMVSLLDTKGSCGLKIARNLRMIQDELKEYYQRKEELFKKYGDIKKLNDDKKICSPNFEEFMKQLNELDLDVEFPFRKITEQELIDSGLSAKQMA